MVYKSLSFIILSSIIGCTAEAPLPFIGIKMNSLYERDMKAWSLKNPGETYTHAPANYPAKVYLDGKWTKGNVRVRGDLSRHWNQEAKSLRISLDTEAYKQMTDFDLIVADDKSYELEGVAYEVSKLMGLPTPAYGFIDVQMNHRKLGTYFLMERWSQAAFELRGYQHGTVISENNAWLNRLRMNGKSLYADNFNKKAVPNPIALQQTIYRASGDSTESQLGLSYFSQMLAEMRRLQSNPTAMDWNKYIDVDKASKWAAIALYFGSEHAVLGDNVRWFYSSSDGRFIPLVYDVLHYSRFIPANGCIYTRMTRLNPWLEMWFAQPEFKASILKHLKFLLNTPETDFDHLWKKVSEAHNHRPWSSDAQKSRVDVVTRVKKNIQQSKTLEAKDFCL